MVFRVWKKDKEFFIFSKNDDGHMEGYVVDRSTEFDVGL